MTTAPNHTRVLEERLISDWLLWGYVTNVMPVSKEKKSSNLTSNENILCCAQK